MLALSRLSGGVSIVQDNLFEWHFTVRGADDSEFAGGVYHGRITLPAEYPMKPPSIMLLTVRYRACAICSDSSMLWLPFAAEWSIPDEYENLPLHQWVSSRDMAAVVVE